MILEPSQLVLGQKNNPCPIGFSTVFINSSTLAHHSLKLSCRTTARWVFSHVSWCPPGFSSLAVPTIRASILPLLIGFFQQPPPQQCAGNSPNRATACTLATIPQQPTSCCISPIVISVRAKPAFILTIVRRTISFSTDCCAINPEVQSDNL